MAVNTMSFNQLATVLNAIVSQATGKEQITPVNDYEFVSVAKIGLETGYDNLCNSISQVLGKTIFSIRPYSAKLKGLEMNPVRYGNHIRKLQLVDGGFEDDGRLPLTDGASVDQFKVAKPKVVQTNFYGYNTYEIKYTLFRDQLNTAFSNAEEFGRFIDMVVTNVNDQIEKAKEEMARATLCNYIAGKAVCDSGNVIYLLDKYEAETGLTGLTPEIIKQPEYFAPFAKWLMGFMKTTSDLLTERSVKFHKNFVDGDNNTMYINRHTPLSMQKCYIYAKELNNIDASVLSSTFHDNYLKIMDHERVNFWQALEAPQQISVKPGYNADNGSIVANPAAVNMSNVFGIIFDEEAMGYMVKNQWSAPSPFNAKGGYTNVFFHFDTEYFNDFTENAVVLVLDHSADALGALTVTSEEGTSSGTTKITVAPAKGASNSYVYKTGTAAEVVTYGMDLSTWTDWNGSADITPTAGDTVITMAEVNASDKALKAGYATIVKKA